MYNSEGVFVTLRTQHAMFMHYILTCGPSGFAVIFHIIS